MSCAGDVRQRVPPTSYGDKVARRLALCPYLERGMKVTKWYPGNVKPVRAGIYETKSPFFGGDPGWFAHWDGEKWSAAFKEPELARDARRAVNVFQAREWRGLTAPAK